MQKNSMMEIRQRIWGLTEITSNSQNQDNLSNNVNKDARIK